VDCVVFPLFEEEEDDEPDEEEPDDEAEPDEELTPTTLLLFVFVTPFRWP
jgi:hypothetical protein